MSDIWTIFWKEWRDSLMPGGRTELLRPIIYIVLVGFAWPLIYGVSWLNFSPVMVGLSVYLPFFFILNYIGDAFAGERERHTLETLLASRISDRAILLGKLIATVTYVFGMALVSSLVGAVVINVSKGLSPWMFYAPFGQWLELLVLIVLVCLLPAGGGILVSLHSATVRQAQQTLLLGSLGLGIAIFLAVRALSAQGLLTMNTPDLLVFSMLLLVVLDAILLAIALASFHRSRLIGR